MKFRWPKKIKVGGKTYRVAVGNLKDRNLAGFIDEHKSEITIDPTADVQVLLHEIVHASEVHLAARIGEEWVDRISQALSMLIADNPALFRRLADHLGGGK